MFRLFSILSLGILMIPACLNMANDCAQTIVKRAIGPGNKLQAIRLRTDCGSTTTPSSSIRVFENIDTTNIGKPENTILAEAAGTDIYWKNDDTLVIKGVDTINTALLKRDYSVLNSKKAITIIYEN